MEAVNLAVGLAVIMKLLAERGKSGYYIIILCGVRAATLVPAFSWDDTTMLRPWFTGSKLKIYYKI